jgi:patatin-like phospholipase/acyl hydrolase
VSDWFALSPPTYHLTSCDHADGGGIRGLSELIILEEVMYRIKHAEGLKEFPRPCEYFDLIGGTSTGGLFHSLVRFIAGNR